MRYIYHIMKRQRNRWDTRMWHRRPPAPVESISVCEFYKIHNHTLSSPHSTLNIRHAVEELIKSRDRKKRWDSGYTRNDLNVREHDQGKYINNKGYLMSNEIQILSSGYCVCIRSRGLLWVLQVSPTAGRQIYTKLPRGAKRHVNVWVNGVLPLVYHPWWTLLPRAQCTGIGSGSTTTLTMIMIKPWLMMNE